jgi:hypothetical protein
VLKVGLQLLGRRRSAALAFERESLASHHPLAFGSFLALKGVLSHAGEPLRGPPSRVES